MEHSRLLKYFVPRSGDNAMAETPTIKLLYEYKSPENVESEVPGVHKLRDSPASTDDNKLEIATEDFTLSPVITVTKEETTLKKGDLKLQKVSVTEDISEGNGASDGVYFRRTVRRQVSRGIMMKTDSMEEVNGKSEDKTKVAEKEKRTRIPKLRQTVERLKERGVSKVKKDTKEEVETSKDKKDRTAEKKENETSTVIYRRSSIPKLKDRRHHGTVVKEETKVINKKLTNEPDEEFDKLFEDLVQNRKSQICDDFIVNTKIDDPEKIEIKFEEIVHDYQNDKTKPATVEKVRPSKIPFLKNRRELDIVVPVTDRITKTSSKTEHHKVLNAIPTLKDGTAVSSEISEHRVVTRRTTKTISTQKYDSDKPDEIFRQKETIHISGAITPTDTVEITEIQVQNPTDEVEDTEFKFNENVKVRPGFSRHLRTYKQNVNNDSKVKLNNKNDIVQDTEKDFINVEESKGENQMIIEDEAQLKKQTSMIEIQHIQRDDQGDDTHLINSTTSKDDDRIIQINKQISITEINSTIEDTNNADKIKYDEGNGIRRDIRLDRNTELSQSNSVTKTIVFRESTDKHNTDNIAKSVDIKETNYKENTLMIEGDKVVNNDTDDEKSNRNFEREINKRTPYVDQEKNDNTIIIASSKLFINETVANNDLDDTSTVNDVKTLIMEVRDPEIEREGGEKHTLELSMKSNESGSTNQTKREIDEDTDAKSVAREREVNNAEHLVIKGKVGRIINQIQIMPEAPKKEFSYDIPKKKSVLSRIAMFERQDEPIQQPKISTVSRSKLNLKLPKETPIECITNEVARKPVIVDEVLKENKTYGLQNKEHIKAQVDNVEEIKAVADILEVLDRELEANDEENYTDTEDNLDSEVNKVKSTPKIIPDVPVIIPRPTSVRRDPYVHRKSDYNEKEQRVEVTLCVPLVGKDIDEVSNKFRQESEKDCNQVVDKDKIGNKKLPQHNMEVEQISKTVDGTITLPQVFNKDTVVYERVISINATENKLRNPTNKIENPVKPLSKDYVKQISTRYERNISTSTVENINNTIQTSIITNTNDHVLEMSKNTSEDELVGSKLHKIGHKLDGKKQFTLAKDVPFEFTEDKTKVQKTYEISVTNNSMKPQNKLGMTNKIAKFTNGHTNGLVSELDNNTDVSRTYSMNDINKSDEYNPKYEINNNVNGTEDDIIDNLNAEEHLKRLQRLEKNRELNRAKSLAELDLGDAVKGQVNRLIVRMGSTENVSKEKREVISLKEMPKKQSVLEKIALFERRITPVKADSVDRYRIQLAKPVIPNIMSEEMYGDRIAELISARLQYGQMDEMPTKTLRNGVEMPIIAVGTAMLDPRLTPYIIGAAIDLGYRAFDTAYIYGNEREVGAAIRAKIDDGTVRREELFIINKLWSTFHRQDLVEIACTDSLETMGLTYFDMYLIHNPMSFKEGSDPIPKIATVVQYSTSDFMDAWYGMERLVAIGLVKCIGVSNFNALQVARVVEKGKIKPVVNQVECHPYLTQQRLHHTCTDLGVELICFGILGSKGTPLELKSSLTAVIDDPLVVVMASGLHVTPAQLLIRYQLQAGRSIVVKSSSAAHLWDNLQALHFTLSQPQMDALNALNRNKRTFTFRGMGDTHKNYPFSEAY